MWTLAPDLAYASIGGEEPPRTRAKPADRSPLVSQHRTSDGRWLSLGMLDEDRYWAPACRALGLGVLVRELTTPEARAEHRERVFMQFRDAIARHTRDELDAALRAEGCIFSFYASPPEVLADPAVAANGYAPNHPVHPTLRLSAAPAQFDDELPAVRRRAPAVGEHSREILAELGYAAGEIERFLADRVVVECTPSPPGGASR
jgi:crotonobetainyl-CoA:carnitine CoA-transferase CaiB-like acyl-CoA transferase